MTAEATPVIPPPAPVPVPPTKFDPERTEFWLSSTSMTGTITAAFLSSKSPAVPWISLGTLVLTVTTYAILRTPLAALDKPGVKTRAFWGAVAIVVSSVATAISDADIPGLPPGITKAASMVVAALTAIGYNAIRYRAKNALMARGTT
jgi:hypothetical protein